MLNIQITHNKMENLLTQLPHKTGLHYYKQQNYYANEYRTISLYRVRYAYFIGITYGCFRCLIIQL